MKTISALTLIAVVAAFITPNSVHAGEKERAIIGGVLGGIIIGAVLADDDIHTRVSVGYHNRGHHRSDGYWEWVTVKTWRPGYYERSCDRYGRTRKVWISGHYDYHKKKVWVETRRGGYGRHYRESDDHRYDRYDRGSRNHGYKGDRKGGGYVRNSERVIRY